MHTQLFHFLFFQHADAEFTVASAQLARLLGQVAGCADVAWQVSQIAGLVDTKTYAATLFQCRVGDAYVCFS